MLPWVSIFVITHAAKDDHWFDGLLWNWFPRDRQRIGDKKLTGNFKQTVWGLGDQGYGYWVIAKHISSSKFDSKQWIVLNNFNIWLRSWKNSWSIKDPICVILVKIKNDSHEQLWKILLHHHSPFQPLRHLWSPSNIKSAHQYPQNKPDTNFENNSNSPPTFFTQYLHVEKPISC